MVVLNWLAALPVRETAPVNWVRPPVTVVVMPLLPMATPVAVLVPRLTVAAESMVVLPAVVVMLEAALPWRLKTPVNWVKPPVTVVVMPE